MKTYRTRKSGFTLIEILIVVIILGILAAIVIPQFTNASQDARKSSMASQLQTLKSQIELYKMQHRDIPPDLGTGTPDVTPGWAQITQYSNIDGTNLDPTAPDLAAVPPRNCGPYMQTPPVNPLTQSATVAAPGGAAAGVGWIYTPATGKIHGVSSADNGGAFHETDDGVTDVNSGAPIVYP